MENCSEWDNLKAMNRKISGVRNLFAALLLLAVIFAGFGCATDEPSDANDQEQSNPNMQKPPEKLPWYRFGNAPGDQP